MRSRRLAVPLSLCAAATALAFLQDPGVVVADTKVNLYVDPARFLSQIVSAWTPTTTLGHVFSGQYGGYLFPMAPFFAAGHGLGIPMWIVQRLWLTGLLCLAAWGMVRLIDLMVGEPRGIAQLAAGAVFTFNPYVVTFMDRTSVTLLAYALLPWMLVAVHQGLRDPRGWRWPAVIALLVTSSGGGVNAGVLGWVLLAPILLVLYERWFGEIGAGVLRPYLTRTIPLGVLASLWWLVGLAVNATHGPNILQYTEQPGAIWNPTSLTESLRLMGYWPSYFGLAYHGPLKPFYADAGTLLFSAPVVTATLLLPALALAGLPWTLRRRHAPFCLLLVLVGLLVMEAGFPNGTLLRHGLDFSYYHFSPVQALRTTYKAGPLVAVGLAVLLGMGAAALGDGLVSLWERGWAGGRVFAGLAVAAGIALVAGSVWPLLQGRGLDAALALPHGVAPAWRAEAATLDRTLPAGERAMVLPGQLFGFYHWGGTVDPILPQLTSVPVTERGITPYADLRADDLQWATDALVSQQRALPGQLRPLLDLMGVGAVVSGADGDLARSGEPSPADGARVLAGQGFRHPSAAYGSVRKIAPGAGELASALTLPAVREYRVRTGGMVRVLPRSDPTILDGDGNGVVDLAAFGALAPGRALRYAADLDRSQIRAAARAGARFVVTDSNRRSVLVTSSLFQNAGPVIGPGDPFSPDSAVLDPFPGRGAAAQTVALVGGGISDVRSLESPGFAQYPEHGPFAALDGDPRTAWLADRHLQAVQRWLQVSFPHPRAVGSVELTPFESPRAFVRQVSVNGHTFAVHPGVNRLALGLHGVSTLRVVLTKVTHPPVAAGGGGGITELRIPGVHPVQALRPPTLLSDALRGASLRRDSLSYVFSRETGDRPFARQPVEPEPELGQIAYPGDGETVLSRRFTVPVARRFRARAWVTASATASDAALDRIAGYRGRVSFTSSSRFAGRPGFRASSAFGSGVGGGGGAGTVGGVGDGWVGEWTPALGDWLQVRSPRTLVIKRALRLAPSPTGVRRPTAVRVSWDGGSSGRIAVGTSGVVALGRTVRTHRLRITVLSAGDGRAGVRAVGIGRVRGIEGLGRVATGRSGARLPVSCGGPTLRLGGRLVRMSVRGSIAAFDAGRPLRARACGAPSALAAGPVSLRGVAGPFAVDLLSLSSPASKPVVKVVTGRRGASASGGGTASAGASGGDAGGGGGAVVTPGRVSGGSVSGARVRVDGPSWLVLGESYDPGWRASCDGHSLGTPVPLQGYANGWPLTHSCARLSFNFAPDRELIDGDVLSAAVCAALLLLLLVAWWRGRRAAAPGAASPAAGVVPRPVTRWSARRAIAAAVIGAGVLGFVFALRAGVVLGPLLGLALWRGLPERWATRLAGGLLVIVVPTIYLLHPVRNLGGYNPNYANAEIDAHFVAVLAVCLLGYALVRVLGDLRAARGPMTRGRAGA